MDLDMTPMWDALSDNPLAGPLLVDPIEAINEEGGFYEPDRPVRDWLVPTPIPGVYVSPYEANDPRNCETWPNSPYCNASETIALEDIRKPLTFDFKPTASKCEVCIELYPRLFGIGMAPGVICFRNDTPQCQVPPDKPKPPPPEPEIEQNKKYWIPAAPFPGRTRIVCAGNLLIKYQFGIPRDTSGGNLNPASFTSEEWAEIRAIISENYKMAYVGNGAFFRSIEPLQPTIEPGVTRAPIVRQGWAKTAITSDDYNYFRGGWFFSMGDNSVLVASSQVSIDYGDGKTYKFRLEDWEDNHSCVGWFNKICPSGNPYSGEYIDLAVEGVNSFINPDVRIYFYAVPSWRQTVEGTHDTYFYPAPSDTMAIYDINAEGCGYRPKPVPQPIPEEDMGCCEETLELLEAIYSRLGVDEFPVKAPVLLTQESEEQADLENHAQLWAWNARNLDALMGQFPIKIKITDSDPTKRGNQEVELDLPNVAETLAELFGLVYQAEMNTDLITEMMLRLIPEVLATKNAAITGQSYSKANASFLGYKGEVKEVKVDYNFDVEKTDTLPNFLQSNKKKVQVFQDKSKESVLDILAKLEFAAGIIKAVFYTKPTEGNRLLESIESMLGDEALSIPNKEQWRDWLQRMNRDTGKHNEGQVIQPEIVENVHEGIDKL